MRRLAIRDGWSTFILISLVVLSATWSIESADWADGLGMLTTIAILGLAVGLGVSLARRIPALLAHLLALALGWVVVLFEVTNFLSDAIGGREAKLHFLWHRW
ncbi:MAG TPA: hypothetical protein VFU72_14715, partial [Nitrolancea sp.]|nr:hypothetical protein [Nitrolancea sp.]